MPIMSDEEGECVSKRVRERVCECVCECVSVCVGG